MPWLYLPLSLLFVYTVTNPNYQREGNLVLQDFSHATRHHNDNEIIYAEPFAPLPVKSGNDTSLTSLTGSGGASSPETTSNIYQSLIGKSAESGKTIYKTETTFVKCNYIKSVCYSVMSHYWAEIIICHLGSLKRRHKGRNWPHIHPTDSHPSIHPSLFPSPVHPCVRASVRPSIHYVNTFLLFINEIYIYFSLICCERCS